MNRTQWPLFNRARIKGVSADVSGRGHLLDDLGVVPINIQYAWDSAPLRHDNETAIDRNIRVFAGSTLRSPFPVVWFEWREPLEDCNIKEMNADPYPDLKFTSDCFGLLIDNPKDPDSFVLNIGWSGFSERQNLKTFPAIIYGNLRGNYSSFSKEGEEFLKASVMEIAISDAIIKELGDDPLRLEQFKSELLGSANTIFWSLLLLMCNNVTTVESQPCYRNNKRQKDPSRVIYRELHVEVPPGGSRSHSVSEGAGTMGTAFHIRRGHFADYTKGKGLFGKYHGKYWIPSTAVGDKDYGTVLKSYRLEGVN